MEKKFLGLNRVQTQSWVVSHLILFFTTNKYFWLLLYIFIKILIATHFHVFLKAKEVFLFSPLYFSL